MALQFFMSEHYGNCPDCGAKPGEKHSLICVAQKYKDADTLCPHCGTLMEFLAGRPATESNLYCPKCSELKTRSLFENPSPPTGKELHKMMAIALQTVHDIDSIMGTGWTRRLADALLKSKEPIRL